MQGRRRDIPTNPTERILPKRPASARQQRQDGAVAEDYGTTFGIMQREGIDKRREQQRSKP